MTPFSCILFCVFLQYVFVFVLHVSALRDLDVKRYKINMVLYYPRLTLNMLSYETWRTIIYPLGIILLSKWEQVVDLSFGVIESRSNPDNNANIEMFVWLPDYSIPWFQKWRFLWSFSWCSTVSPKGTNSKLIRFITLKIWHLICIKSKL